MPMDHGKAAMIFLLHGKPVVAPITGLLCKLCLFSLIYSWVVARIIILGRTSPSAASCWNWTKIETTWNSKFLSGSSFFDFRRYIFKVAGNSADTAVNLLRAADASLQWNFCWEFRLTTAIFLRKAAIPADIPQKTPVQFLVLMQKKKLTQLGKQISAEEKQKTLECFFWSKTETIIYQHLGITKVRQNSDKIQGIETKQTFGSIISNCICESENCSTTPSPFLPFGKPVRTLGSQFYNSRHRVMSLTCVWVNGMTGLANGGSHFRMRITLGFVLIRSLVFHVCVPECSRNGSGMRPYLLVQEKFV